MDRDLRRRVEGILGAEFDRAKRLIEAKRAKLVNVAGALLERRKLMHLLARRCGKAAGGNARRIAL